MDIYKEIVEGFDNFPSFLPKSKILKYTTHIPLLLASIQIFPKNKIIEFGSGNFSTHIFYKYFTELFVSIEDNKEWFISMKKKLNPKSGFCPLFSDIFFEFPNRRKEPSYNDITKEDREKIYLYYHGLFKQYGDMDFVFVDQRKYARFIAMDVAIKKSKVIMYHDAQHGTRYSFGKINDIIDRQQQDWYSYRTTYSWTNFIISKDVNIDVEKLADLIKKEEKTYFKMVLNKNPEEEKYIKNTKFSLVKI